MHIERLRLRFRPLTANQGKDECSALRPEREPPQDNLRVPHLCGIILEGLKLMSLWIPPTSPPRDKAEVVEVR